MPTDTFPITSAADDGTAFWGDTGSWASMVDGIPALFFEESDDPANVLFITKGFFSPTFVIELGFVRFDTSSIAATATITAANLLLYVTSAVNGADSLSFIADYYDFGGEPVVYGDYVFNPTSIFTPVGIGSLTTSAVNTIPLTDLTGIKRSGEANGQGNVGITGIRMALSGAAQPTADNHVQVADFENANPEPRLEVTYTIPVASANLAWIRA